MRFNSFANWLKSLSIALLLSAAGLMAPGLARASNPGCVGKMWNPLTDVDYRLMGGIKIVGIPLMKTPSALGEPPDHTVSPVCFCKNGWKTGLGLGLTYWLPTYMADIARQGGCIGFLDGVNILPGFISESSGQEYSMHSKQTEGVTNMQVHWAYADIVGIAGSQLFESCEAISSKFSIAYLTEPDFVYQNDIYSAIMTPQIAILASNAMLTQLACGMESIINTLGGWQDWGVCGWKGTRLPLSGNAISKDMAQVSNMDIILKFLTRQSLMGAMLRTMGKDTACRPQYEAFYNPFQHRFQWSWPAKVSTRYNVDVIRWGLFIKQDGESSMEQLQTQTNGLSGIDTSTAAAGAGPLSIAKQVLASIPKPLNYPTHESGYMQVWEAKTCCLMVLTVENIANKVADAMATQGGELVKQLYDLYQVSDKVYKVIDNPIGGALNLLGDSISQMLPTFGGE